MDGTILTPHHVLSNYSKETIRILTQERRIPFIFATGRLYADVAVVSSNLRSYFKEREGKSTRHISSSDFHIPVYLITSGGAVIHNALTSEVVREECVPPSLVRELYALLPASETRINTNFCQRDKWYCRMDWAEMNQFHQESGQTFEVMAQLPGDGLSVETPKTADSQSANATEGDLRFVSKVFFTSWDKPLLDQLEKLLLQRYGDVLTINYAASYCIDVTLRGADKASALRCVLGLLPPPHDEVSYEPLRGLPAATTDTKEVTALVSNRMARTIAFGNDLNDACMLSSVGKGCITANANPSLIEMLPELEVIGSNEEDGVARKLREVFGIP